MTCTNGVLTGTHQTRGLPDEALLHALLRDEERDTPAGLSSHFRHEQQRIQELQRCSVFVMREGSRAGEPDYCAERRRR